MALSKSALALFASEVAPHLKGGAAIALGVPQMGATQTELEAMFGVRMRDGSYGGWMEALKFRTCCTLDVSAYEKCDYVADLNQPIAGLPKFDLVIDNGTVEHCFNVAQALFNTKALCKVGGYIFHNNPANWFGHGFWSMSPCVYFDFYEANGFEVQVFLRDVAKATWQRLDYHPRVTRILEGRQVIHAVARRVSVEPDYVPTQRWCLTLHSGFTKDSKIPPATEGRTRFTPQATARSAPFRSLMDQVRGSLKLSAMFTSDLGGVGNGFLSSSIARKLRKLRRDPQAFFRDAELISRRR